MNKEMIEAIENTIALHQLAIDGTYSSYRTARAAVCAGICPLCSYAAKMATHSDVVNSCDLCPWRTIQEPDSNEDEPCDHLEFSILDPVQSIARLESWLREEIYEE